MHTFASRAFSFTDLQGNSGELVLTLEPPHPTEHHGVPIWKCEYAFGPPIAKKHHAVGVDFIQAFVCALQIARGYLLGYFPDGRIKWQGRTDCGLPLRESAHADDEQDIPSREQGARGLRSIATRNLGYRDETGQTRKVLLSVFEPIADNEHSWKCGIAFDYEDGADLQYGRGEDKIEAMLDALAIARLVFLAMTSNGSLLEDVESLACDDLPQKINGAFLLSRADAA